MNVPLDSAIGCVAVPCVPVTCWVVYAVYWPGVPSVCTASCDNTKLAATVPSVNRPLRSTATPLPSVSVKLTVAVPLANASPVTAMSTPGCVSHGDGPADSPGEPASPVAPGAPFDPGSPCGPCGPAGPVHAATTKIHANVKRMTAT